MSQLSAAFVRVCALYPDSIVLIRIGDFYETFAEQAKTVSAKLGLTITTREKNAAEPLAMCGFPYHQIDAYTRKLCSDGFRVVVLEHFDQPRATVYPGGFHVSGNEIRNAEGNRVAVMTSHAKAASAALMLSKHSDELPGDDSPAADDCDADHAEPVPAPRLDMIPATLPGFLDDIADDPAPAVPAAEIPAVSGLISADASEQSPGISAELADDSSDETDDDETAADDTPPQTLPKWKTSAGPRQSKLAVKAISEFITHGKFSREITDYGEHLVCTMLGFGAAPCPAAVTIHNALHTEFSGEITAKNHKLIAARFSHAKHTLTLPVIDNRTTAEERAQQAKERAEREAAQSVKAAEMKAAESKAVAELRERYPWAVGRDAYKTTSARAAANLKEELKRTFPGVKFKVRSETFSMGDSVDVYWDLGPSDKAVQAISKKYQDGWFNGMEDIYETDRSAEGSAVEIVLGRAKYVHTHRQNAWELINKLAPVVCELFGVPCENGIDSPIYENGNRDDLRRLLTDIVHNHDFPPCVTLDDVTGIERVENPGSCEMSDRFRLVYNVTTPQTSADISAPISQACGAFTIEKHFHTKRNAFFWLVIPANRLEREAYDALLTSARNAGGWQSRKWGKTPSGFGFETEQAAADFVASITGTGNTSADVPAGALISADASEQSPGNPTASPAPAPVTIGAAMAEKLRTMADGMTSDIEHHTRDLSQNWTFKRGREHASRVFKGEQLKRAQTALYALADAWEAGTIPPILRGLKTKTAVVELCANRAERHHTTDSIFDSGEPANNSPEAVALRALVESAKTDQHKRAEEIARQKQAVTQAENALRSANCPGFFPSPPAVCETLIQRAELPAELPADFRILEPSAGIGSICEALQASGVPADRIRAVEIRSSMADVVRLKGFQVLDADFLEVSRAEIGTFDRILMNPPFERSQDIDHVRHALRFLKPGGVLVSVVSASVTFRSDVRFLEFRSLCQELNAEFEELPEGSFTGRDSFRQTGVNAHILTIRKPFRDYSADVASQPNEEPAAIGETVPDAPESIETPAAVVSADEPAEAVAADSMAVAETIAEESPADGNAEEPATDGAGVSPEEFAEVSADVDTAAKILETLATLKRPTLSEIGRAVGIEPGPASNPLASRLNRILKELREADCITEHVAGFGEPRFSLPTSLSFERVNEMATPDTSAGSIAEDVTADTSADVTHNAAQRDADSDTRDNRENLRRVRRARRALADYLTPDNSETEAFTDCLADLMHAAESHGVDFREALRIAGGHYATESDSPEASEVSAFCDGFAFV